MNGRIKEGSRGHLLGEASMPFYYTHNASRRYKQSQIEESYVTALRLRGEGWKMAKEDVRVPLLNYIVSTVGHAPETQAPTSIIFSYEDNTLLNILEAIANGTYQNSRRLPNLAGSLEFSLGVLLYLNHGWDYPTYQLDVTLNGDSHNNIARADFIYRNTPKRIKFGPY